MEVDGSAVRRGGAEGYTEKFLNGPQSAGKGKIFIDFFIFFCYSWLSKSRKLRC
jgi:hypothetical protein